MGTTGRAHWIALEKVDLLFRGKRSDPDKYLHLRNAFVGWFVRNDGRNILTELKRMLHEELETKRPFCSREDVLVVNSNPHFDMFPREFYVERIERDGLACLSELFKMIQKGTLAL